MGSYCFLLCLLTTMAMSVIAKKGKIRAAPGWSPFSSEEEDSPVLTRHIHLPDPFSSLPLPPIDPDIDLDDRSVLFVANRRRKESSSSIPVAEMIGSDETIEVEATTETTNIRVMPFEGHRHKTILPIPPPISSQQVDDSSGEEESRTRSEMTESGTSEEEPSPPHSILVPVEVENRNVEFIPVGEVDRSIRMPSHIHRPPRRQIVKIRRPRPPSRNKFLSPPGAMRRRIIAPSIEFVDGELESEELVPADPEISDSYSSVAERPPMIEENLVREKIDYRGTRQPSRKKTRKVYKIYRPNVIEVERGGPPRSIYVAEKPPILVEQIEIPTEVIENLHKYSTSSPVDYKRTTLHRGAGKFAHRQGSHRRTYRRSDTFLTETTTPSPVTVPTPSYLTKRPNTPLKRLPFTYNPKLPVTKPYPRTTPIPVQVVYKKPSRKLLVERERPSILVKQVKKYPRHQRYLRAYNRKPDDRVYTVSKQHGYA